MRTKNNSGDQSQSNLTFIEAARRAQIIECAIETIAELGFVNASLAQIAKRANISKGVISYHFKDKGELIEQIVTMIYTAGADYMRPRIDAALEQGPLVTLQTYIRANMEFIRANPQEMLALVEIFTSFRTPEGKPHYTAADGEAALEPLKNLLAWGQEEGVFRPFDTRILAVTIRQAIDAVPTQMAANAALDLDLYTDELVNLFDHATQIIQRR